MPGPIVDDIVTLRRNLPFAADGLAFTTLSTSACAFSIRLCDGNEILPTGACTMPVLSTRNSTLPALISRTAWAMFGVTVPVFGLGIRPRGPSTLPSLPTARIMSGVATTASKSIQPPWILSTSSSPPTKSAPASCASFCLSPPAMARTRLVLPRPCGRTTVPRTIWSACFGSTPRRSAISTVSSNFANFTFCMRGIASSIVCGRSGTCCRAAANFLPCLRMLSSVVQTADVRPPTFRLVAVQFQTPNCQLPNPGSLELGVGSSSGLTDDVDAHRARGAGDGLVRLVERLGVEVGHLELGDVLDLLLGHGADLVLVRLVRSLREVRGALEQDRRRRRLRDEGVGAVRVDSDDGGDDQPFVLRGPRVEVLAEVHDVQPVRAERGAHGGRRRRLAGGDLELHNCRNFLRHDSLSSLSVASRQSPVASQNDRRPGSWELAAGNYNFSTCKKSSSTGVERPKIVTMTFSVLRSRLTSSTMPLKLVNGPSLIRTWSPFSKEYFGFGFSAATVTWWRIWSTSSRVSGVGLAPAPTKPVTLGVFLTTCHALSDMCISTRM